MKNQYKMKFFAFAFVLGITNFSQAIGHPLDLVQQQKSDCFLTDQIAEERMAALAAAHQEATQLIFDNPCNNRHSCFLLAQHAHKFRQLQHLDIPHFPSYINPNSMLEQLAPTLTYLALGFTQNHFRQDLLIRQEQFPQLRHLALSGCTISEDFIKHLPTTITHLTFTSCEITVEALERINKDTFPSLEAVSLQLHNPDARSLRALINIGSALTSLSLSGCYCLPNGFLRKLAPSIKHIGLLCCNIVNSDLAIIADRFNQLESLEISEVNDLEETTFANMPQSLRFLKATDINLSLDVIRGMLRGVTVTDDYSDVPVAATR